MFITLIITIANAFSQFAFFCEVISIHIVVDTALNSFTFPTTSKICATMCVISTLWPFEYNLRSINWKKITSPFFLHYIANKTKVILSDLTAATFKQHIVLYYILYLISRMAMTSLSARQCKCCKTQKLCEETQNLPAQEKAYSSEICAEVTVVLEAR